MPHTSGEEYIASLFSNAKGHIEEAAQLERRPVRLSSACRWAVKGASTLSKDRTAAPTQNSITTTRMVRPDKVQHDLLHPAMSNNSASF